MLINLSNHPGSLWSDEQVSAAARWGEVVDLPFPQVPPDADEEFVRRTADDLIGKICSMQPDAVMCQGEYTLTYAVVSRLKERGMTVVSACTERLVDETVVDGQYEKKVRFAFARFREY